MRIAKFLFFGLFVATAGNAQSDHTHPMVDALWTEFEVLNRQAHVRDEQADLRRLTLIVQAHHLHQVFQSELNEFLPLAHWHLVEILAAAESASTSTGSNPIAPQPLPDDRPPILAEKDLPAWPAPTVTRPTRS